MAAVAEFSLLKPRSRPNPALTFILSIESTWKGQEPFAMWLIQKIKPKTVVDLGFHRGLSTIVFAYKNPGHVFGIDWFEVGSYAEKAIVLEKAFQNISDAIRFNYVKNIHLIIGPFHDVSRTWNRSIDLLHIDLASSYAAAKFHYDNWKRYLQKGSVILIHDINRYPTEVGRFFNELPLPKILLPAAGGLGVASTNHTLIEAIRAEWLN